MLNMMLKFCLGVEYDFKFLCWTKLIGTTKNEIQLIRRFYRDTAFDFYINDEFVISRFLLIKSI